MDVKKLLKEKLASLENVARSASDIGDDEEIIAGLGIDSLDYASVLIECETILKISVQEDDIDWRRIRTVSQLADLLAASRKVA